MKKTGIVETTTDKPMSIFHFKFMALGYRFRNFFSPRKDILKEVGIKPGFQILDYGCGPGGYLTPLAKQVGKHGKIYSLDIHPLALRKVRELAEKKHLTNVETIQSGRETGLADGSVDLVLLYDIYHELGDPNGVLEELHRVLKEKGILSFSDHHMNENDVISGVTNGGLFKLLKKNKRTYSFSKEEL